MTNRIFRAIYLSVILAILLSAGLLFSVLYTYATNTFRQELRSEIDLTARGLENEGISFLKGINPGHLRITWIQKDGTVLYDSEENPKTMQNHLNREEVQEALKNGYGESQRYSSTLLERMLYAAKRLKDGSVLRLSVSQESVLAMILEILQPAAVILIALVIASWFSASYISRKIVRPLNELDLDHPLENEQYDELSPLLRRISSQQGEIQIQKNVLSRKQNELDTILNHMSEGMILINKEGKIMSINASAAEILGIYDTMPGRNLLSVSRDYTLIRAVEQALGGRTTEEILELHSGQFQVNAVPVQENNEVLGVSIMMYDVTDTKMAEAMRHEFTANVSHELKTPLQSISGYAELLKNHIVKKGDEDLFAEKIYREAQRMRQLIEDIISLSHLDEGASNVNWEWADLAGIAAETIEEMKREAAKKEIHLTLTGMKQAPMTGKKALLGTIVRNLCDNAIKYGRKGGHVTVDVREGSEKNFPGYLILTVTDDGIGIPKEDQKRVFERFYRVDKSHSKAIGGTGLGLSIVRHAVLIHHGKIELESELGMGSKFTVYFPKTQRNFREERSKPE